MFNVASWNLNSVRSRLAHVTTWLKARNPDVLLLQELKGMEFPSEVSGTGLCECRGYPEGVQRSCNSIAPPHGNCEYDFGRR